jgi:DegV family protein with EDD domain
MLSQKEETNMLQLVTDSSCDLPEELVKRYNIHIVPLTVNIDGVIYRENVDISPKEFYEKMKKSRNLPRTSLPTPTSFSDVFKKLSQSGPVLCITISSGLSGTYQSACHGKELSGANVTVFDSLGGSLGHGLQVLKAAKLAESGHPLEKIVNELEKYRSGLNILILLNTLDNIVKGGRLSRFQGSLGKLLDIKILLHNDKEGKVVLQAKARGKKKFMDTVLDKIIKLCPDMTSVDVGITHLDNLEDAEFIKKELMVKCHARSVLINDMGVTMATYAGEGGMIVSF